MKRPILLALLLLTASLLFLVVALSDVFTLDALKAHRIAIQSFYSDSPGTAILGFALACTLSVAFSLPIATLFTLAAGVIFGPWLGTLIVAVSDTVGAAIAFLSARFIFRQWLTTKYGTELRDLDAHISENALSYLLFLRLVPVLPFFLVNLLFGLTAMRLRAFIFGTFVGILPIAFVFSNAGSRLAAIDSVDDVTSPALIASLAAVGALALVPVVYRLWRRSP